MDEKPSDRISELTREALLKMPALNEMQAGILAISQFLDELQEKEVE